MNRACQTSFSTLAIRRSPSAYPRPSRVDQAWSRKPLDRPTRSSGTTSSSSSRISSSGPIRASPIAARKLPSSSSGTPASWLTRR